MCFRGGHCNDCSDPNQPSAALPGSRKVPRLAPGGAELGGAELPPLSVPSLPPVPLPLRLGSGRGIQGLWGARGSGFLMGNRGGGQRGEAGTGGEEPFCACEGLTPVCERRAARGTSRRAGRRCLLAFSSRLVRRHFRTAGCVHEPHASCNPILNTGKADKRCYPYDLLAVRATCTQNRQLST